METFRNQYGSWTPGGGRAFPLTRQGAVIFGVAAGVVFTMAAWAITVLYREQAFAPLFTRGYPLGAQLAVGVVAGTVLGGVLAGALLRVPALSGVRAFALGIMDEVRPTTADILVISIAAGVGEEVFFRGALQPLWGLWLASLAFALAHVGGHVFSAAKAGFAAYVFAMGVLLGLIFEHAGLTAAIAAHAVCDAVFLLALKGARRS